MSTVLLTAPKEEKAALDEKALAASGPRVALIGWILLTGLALRLIHYLLDHTIWYDEAVLLANILGKDYGQLLGPLESEVAAPPLFLWSLRTIAVLFGDHSYVWRLPFFIISCLQLVLTARLARLTLRPGSATFLVALVAFSDAFVLLGCNIKPYILDAFLATAILYAYVRTERWSTERRLLLFAAAAPFLLCFSYALLFVYCGVFAAFLPALWRERRVGTLAAYLGLIAAVLATMVVLYLGPIHAQRVPGLVAGWQNKFPDLSRPLSVPGWILGNTFLVFHYCYNPIGVACFFFALAGVFWCWRNKRLDWAFLCLGPVAAGLLAAVAQAYPYSNNRLILFAAPGIGLITCLGLTGLLEWPVMRRTSALLILVTLLILPEIGYSAWHLWRPWLQPDSTKNTQLVRSQRQPGDLVASDDGTYLYFFFGELRSMKDIASGTFPAGQRVWVVMDHYLPDKCRADARQFLLEPEWELASETPCRKAIAFLFIRRGPVSPGGPELAYSKH